MKFKFLYITVYLLLIGTASYAQSLYLALNNGTNASFNLDNIRKVTFDPNVMNLQLNDGTVHSWNISTIDYFFYVESSLNLVENLVNNDLLFYNVFPNPVSSELNINYKLHQEDIVTIALYDLKGKVVLEKRVGKKTSGAHFESIDLSSMPKGIYACVIQSPNFIRSKKVYKQ